MDKKELFDAFDGFSQNLMITLAEIEAMINYAHVLLNSNKKLLLNLLNKVKNILKVFITMVSISVMIITDNVVKMMKNVCSVWKF